MVKKKSLEIYEACKRGEITPEIARAKIEKTQDEGVMRECLQLMKTW